MSHSVDEQLSAFLDGELPEAELELLLARLDRDPGRRELLARYGMIGECIRTGTAEPLALPIAERVRAALAAPDAAPQVAVVARPATFHRGWAAGAVAAGAALIAIMVAGPGSWQLPSPLPSPIPPPAPLAATGLLDEAVAPITATVRHRVDPRAAARLTNYLVAHGEFANELSRASLDSHVVSARAERAVWQQTPYGTNDR